MAQESFPSLFFNGKKLDTSSNAFGKLRSSRDALDDRDELSRRMDKNGYLYLPGLLSPDDVMDARTDVLEKMCRLGQLSPDYPLSEAVANEKTSDFDLFDLAKNNASLEKILYSGPMMKFYRNFLGGPVRSFDYTWLRANLAGEKNATPPHYDIVYMGRGTKNLYTSWTPLGDVPLTLGGLMILENSHLLEKVKSTYGQMDVDAYCTNNEEAEIALADAEDKEWHKLWPARVNGGMYSHDPISLRENLNRRWLSTDYQVGDVLVFSMFTMHASMDNQTNCFRLSTDSRYQLAADPIDERWVGKNPIGHTKGAKKGMIC